MCKTQPRSGSRERQVVPLLAMVLLLMAPLGAISAEEAPSLDVVYVPTPMPAVERMLELAQPKPGEQLIDLGSGDGRIPIAAAKTYGINALGVDLDMARIEEGRQNARAEGVADKVTFRRQDLFETDISKADILTLYLLPRINNELKPRILAEMAPGSRVVSHAFAMSDWEPVHEEKVDGSNIYMWVVPARADGRWVVGNGESSFEIYFEEERDQEFGIKAEARADGEPVSVEDLQVRGEQISFALMIDGVRHRFEARIDAGSLVDLSSDRGGVWTARPT